MEPERRPRRPPTGFLVHFWHDRAVSYTVLLNSRFRSNLSVSIQRPYPMVLRTRSPRGYRASIPKGRHRPLQAWNATRSPGPHFPFMHYGVPRLWDHLRRHTRKVPLPHLWSPRRLHPQPRQRPARNALDSRA